MFPTKKVRLDLGRQEMSEVTISKYQSRTTCSMFPGLYVDEIPLELALLTLVFLFLLILRIPRRISALLVLTVDCLAPPLLFMTLKGEMKTKS